MIAPSFSIADISSELRRRAQREASVGRAPSTAAPPPLAPAAARPTPSPPSPPPPQPGPIDTQRQAEPPRYWAQIATGSQPDALRFTFRQLAGRAPEAFAEHDAWTAPYGATSRLLVGPFASNTAAQGFVNAAGAARIQSFAWRSAAGEAVARLYPEGRTPRPARTASAPAVAPTPAAQPSRHWAQIAVGQREDALRFTYRQFARRAPRAFAGKSGWFTPWGETNRLLVGPFASEREARAFLTAIEAEADIDGLTFQSIAGQEIERLAGQ